MARQPKPEIKPTRATRRVLLVLLSGSPSLYGYSICRAAMVGSGTLYPLLERLEKAGWAERYWSQGADARGNRRALYELTFKGRYGAFRMLGLEMPDD